MSLPFTCGMIRSLCLMFSLPPPFFIFFYLLQILLRSLLLLPRLSSLNHAIHISGSLSSFDSWQLSFLCPALYFLSFTFTFIWFSPSISVSASHLEFITPQSSLFLVSKNHFSDFSWFSSHVFCPLGLCLYLLCEFTDCSFFFFISSLQFLILLVALFLVILGSRTPLCIILCFCLVFLHVCVFLHFVFFPSHLFTDFCLITLYLPMSSLYPSFPPFLIIYLDQSSLSFLWSKCYFPRGEHSAEPMNGCSSPASLH